jgi:hypothetical protein
MNREILFRAKCFGNWRYGSYVHFDKKPTIFAKYLLVILPQNLILLVMTKNTKKDDGSYRRADNGRYCTEEYAKRHPKTTIHENR